MLNKCILSGWFSAAIQTAANGDVRRLGGAGEQQYADVHERGTGEARAVQGRAE